MRKKFGVSVVALRRPEGEWEPVEAATMLYDSDEILVTGPTHQVEAFSNLK